ncbi:hypothetical protein RSAG8_06473, partial [Rhizoctonia solani AG-8 WAC10335]
MSSRDATLAERLNTLDDAIEAWSTDARLPTASASGAPPVGELQTPPGSEADTRAQPVIQDQSVVQDILEQDQQLQSLDKIIQDADSLDDNGPIQPELDGNGSPASQASPGLSSDQQDNNSSALLTQRSAKPAKTPGRGRKTAGAPQSAPPKSRRSSRQSKKRQRNDDTVESISKSEARVGGKSPRKSVFSQFNWGSVLIQDEELEQLIYCDKCDQSYHWGCVNILPEDPILQVDTWLCPPCEYEDQHGPIPGRTHDPDIQCRPDCPVQDHADDMFAIDAIIGRFPHSADPSGMTMQYI